MYLGGWVEGGGGGKLMFRPFQYIHSEMLVFKILRLQILINENAPSPFPFAIL